MICSKTFALTVNEVTAIFTWGAGTVLPGPGTASFTPTSADGNTAVADTSVPPAGVGASTALNTGSMIWNSNAVVPANMNITVATVGVNPDPTLIADITVNVVAPASNLLTVVAGTDIGYNNTMDFPFNLPDTGGADWTIEWFQDSFSLSNPTNGGSIIITGIFTLV